MNKEGACVVIILKSVRTEVFGVCIGLDIADL